MTNGSGNASGDDAMPVAAVVLAAGASSRFGSRNKLLMPWGRGHSSIPVLRHVVQTLARAGLSEIVVVTGNERAAVHEALAGVEVAYAYNNEWAAGMGHSIATGVASVSKLAAAAFVVPGDMPGLTVEVITRLEEALIGSQGKAVVVPVTPDGHQRNPVLWPRALFPQLLGLTGDKGAKGVLASGLLPRIDVVMSDPHVFADIDHEADYLALREALHS